MTIIGWVIYAALAFCIVLACMGIGSTISIDEVSGAIKGLFVSAAICIVLLACMLFYFNGTASGKRAYKTQESNLHNGIDRSVEVYDATGNLLKSYSGKFDIDYDDNRIIFDDENNKRHVIYYPTGTVIVDEV